MGQSNQLSRLTAVLTHGNADVILAFAKGEISGADSGRVPRTRSWSVSVNWVNQGQRSEGILPFLTNTSAHPDPAKAGSFGRGAF